MRTSTTSFAALTLAALGSAWPILVCAAQNALTSPFERLMRASMCGQAHQAMALLGHGWTCWSGAAALVAAAVLAASAQLRPSHQAAISSASCFNELKVSG